MSSPWRGISRRWSFLLLTLCGFSLAWIAPVRHGRQHSFLYAKRNRRSRNEDETDRWYDAVDADASPDDVFWQEMERQRLFDESPPTSPTNGIDPVAAVASIASPQLATPSAPPTPASGGPAMGGSSKPNSKSIDATLSQYDMFAVEDNWLNDDLQWMLDQSEYYMNDDAPSLDDQLDEWEQQQDGEEDEEDLDNAWMQSDEPWDNWGETQDSDSSLDTSVTLSNKADEFLFQDSSLEEQEMAEIEFWNRMDKCAIKSQRLEKARDNPKAQAFFQREPDVMEGYDRMWVSAIDPVSYRNLVGILRNYGIQFADNFGDFKDERLEDGHYSIEDVASFKARQVFNVTGLPCIASRTSFEVEPLFSEEGRDPTRPVAMPRVASGYQFNDIGDHVDYVCDAMRPVSPEDRVTRFKTCLCYFDGEVEVFDYGVLDVDIVFANSMRTYIPMSQAINEMSKTLELTFGLEYQKWLKARMTEALSGVGEASRKLRDRVLKEGKVLPNDIIDVSAFMDSKIDVNLMDYCAEELSNRFVDQKPSKILTVATTGLVIALPMAKYLQVPVVYARKERNVVMADTYKASYSSKTVGLNRELLVSKSHLEAEDRVLIVDDFLSSGSSQGALLQLVADAGATSVGVGVLLEKVYDSGRPSLSGFDIPVESLCKVASVEGGVIQLEEEEGFGLMKKQNAKSLQ